MKIGLIAAAAGALLTLSACATQVPTDNGACAATKCAPCAPSCKGCPSCKGACRSCGE
jgi:hypothetical protein